ncbi:MAG: hypothetical protein JNG89_21655 [Planctomycetaceae bacterium]|nr:hypothetical protein [Planctomycetaceae bacterium]
MNDTDIELSIGETVLVGEVSVTILDVEGDQIHFRIDPPPEHPNPSVGFDMRRWMPPR